MPKILNGSLVLAAVVTTVSLVSAHHSTTAEFDVTHKMTISGTLTKVDWVNPHIVVFMDGKAVRARGSSKAIRLRGSAASA